MSDSEVRPQDEPEGAIKPEDLAENQPPDETPQEPEHTGTKHSVQEVAQQVINGEFGVGQDRRRRIAEAGYDLKKVDEAVKELLNKKR